MLDSKVCMLYAKCVIRYWGPYWFVNSKLDLYVFLHNSCENGKW